MQVNVHQWTWVQTLHRNWSEAWKVKNTVRIEIYQELITYYTIDGINSVIRKAITITKSTFQSTSRLKKKHQQTNNSSNLLALWTAWQNYTSLLFFEKGTTVVYQITESELMQSKLSYNVDYRKISYSLVSYGSHNTYKRLKIPTENWSDTQKRTLPGTNFPLVWYKENIVNHASVSALVLHLDMSSCCNSYYDSDQLVPLRWKEIFWIYFMLPLERFGAVLVQSIWNRLMNANVHAFEMIEQEKKKEGSWACIAPACTVSKANSHDLWTFFIHEHELFMITCLLDHLHFFE